MGQLVYLSWKLGTYNLFTGQKEITTLEKHTDKYECIFQFLRNSTSVESSGDLSLCSE